jgi:hypothetical protein
VSGTDIDIDHIPRVLRDLPRWVGWRYVVRDGEETKCPINARSGKPAKSTDPGTWTTFDEALAAYRADSLAGVGFVFTREDGFAGVDLDDAVDPTTGALKPWAREIVEDVDSYTEVSPSGQGVKVFLQATKPGSRCRKAYHDGEVEIYDADRFFTVTGRWLPDVSGEVEARQAELERLYTAVFGEDTAPAPPQDTPSPSSAPRLTDAKILDLARSSRASGEKFRALYDTGDWNAYFNSPSEADASIVFTLAFYTKDPAQLDRLFRNSQLHRDKWDELRGEKTYGQITIEKALANVTGQYQTRRQRKRRKKRKQTETPVAPPASDLPNIVTSDVQLADLTAQGLDALRQANAPPEVFVRSGALCRVVPDENALPAVSPFDRTRMRCRLGDVARFYAVTTEGEYVSVNPPLYLAENILARGAWDFPPLVGVTRSPILRPDGTLCTRHGYDAATRLYYVPDADLVVPPIPANPSPEECDAARDLILDLVAEFPFVDRASVANTLAILLTILMRPVIAGHTPLAIVDATVQGTGKSLLVQALGTVAVGTVSGESIPARQNEDEWRKKITSILLGGPTFVLLDNIPDNTTIDSANLAAMLTTPVWSDRLLGKTEHLDLPVRSVWVATGNNLRVTGDMPRRCYTVKLDANVERPWERTGWRHPDLIGYAREHRGELLAAAFTVVRAWYAAGCPKARVRTFGSFQAWADTVGSVLAHAGIEGFLENLDQTRSVQDEDTRQWQAFFTAWWEVFGTQGVTSDDLCQRIVAHNTIPDASLPDALVVNRDRGEGSLKRSLGRNLARLTGRIFDGRKLSDAGTKGHTKVRSWRLEAVAGLSDGIHNPANPAVTPHLTPQANVSNDKGLEQNAGLQRLFCSTPRARAGARTHAREITKGLKITPHNPVNPASGPEGEALVL